MSGHIYQVNLVIQSLDKHKSYLEEIAFDWAEVSDNIAYHLGYLEYLYQINRQIPLESYPFLNGLRIKTIIVEIASCAEVLLYDALIHTEVVDKWSNRNPFKLKPSVGFTVMLQYAVDYAVITTSLHGRLHKLFDLRHKIHLTHCGRDPYEFNESLLKDSERTYEDLIKHFLDKRYRAVSKPKTDFSSVPFPWKEIL